MVLHVFSNNHAKIKIDSYNSCYNINIKLVFNNYQNHYYYNIFSEKCLYQLGEK